VGYYREIKDLLNLLHISNIFDEFPVVLVTEIFEENENEKLILGVCLLRKPAGIGLEGSRLYNRNSSLDKPDIPAC